MNNRPSPDSGRTDHSSLTKKLVGLCAIACIMPVAPMPAFFYLATLHAETPHYIHDDAIIASTIGAFAFGLFYYPGLLYASSLIPELSRPLGEALTAIPQSAGCLLIGLIALNTFGTTLVLSSTQNPSLNQN